MALTLANHSHACCESHTPALADVRKYTSPVPINPNRRSLEWTDAMNHTLITRMQRWRKPYAVLFLWYHIFDKVLDFTTRFQSVQKIRRHQLAHMFDSLSMRSFHCAHCATGATRPVGCLIEYNTAFTQKHQSHLWPIVKL